MNCKVCSNQTGNVAYEAKEMMFGFRDSFLYFQCNYCKCLQINTIPENLEAFYPNDYYSFKKIDEAKYKTFGKRLHVARIRATMFNKKLLSQVVRKFFPVGKFELFDGLNLDKSSRIVDVGSGNGSFFLYGLAEAGFKNLLGIDPFIESDIDYENGLKVLKKSFYTLENHWDLIIFHHSFEHMPDPNDIFLNIHNKLSPNGICIIAIPTVSSFAWRHYGVHWAQLDAPRHLFLHSTESMCLLADSFGLKIDRIVYNSGDFQFAGSEGYIKGISLQEQIKNKYNENFFKRKFKRWKYLNKAKELNKNADGDQAVFYITKK